MSQLRKTNEMKMGWLRHKQRSLRTRRHKVFEGYRGSYDGILRIASVNGDMTSLQQQLVREPVVLPFLWSLVLSMNDTVADTFEPLLYLKGPALKYLTLADYSF
ncbi:hypothetical protein CC2G_000055 [Coprinopsis cinerea AmutBmut pab1-1]|nr:hypothetical protein CC2G_000055 [Coprinopsis cinerea AmutBmut pab1-1]